jgi:hypothetical protein
VPSKAPALSSSSSSSVSSGVTLSSLEPELKKKRRSSSGSDVKQEILPIHNIRRSLPLHISSSNPAQCLDMIDRMYNIYYEIEVIIIFFIINIMCSSIFPFPFPDTQILRMFFFRFFICRSNLAQSHICRNKETLIRR